MLVFIVRRIFWTIPVLLVVIFLTFIMMRQIGGNPFRHSERAVPEAVQRNLEQKFHVNDPWWKQYAYYVKGVATLDFGPSLVLRGQTVNDIIKEHFMKSVELGFYAFLFAIVVGVPLGVIAALKHNTVIDYSAMFFSNIFHAIPSFLVATLMIYWFALKFGAVPTSGWSTWQHKILPSIALGFAPMALFARLVRGTMLETLQQDYVRTARAKGLRYRRVVGLHVLRNSLIPVITAAGPLLGFIITGSFVIELIFNIPGIGQYYVTAVNARDYSVVMGLTVLLSVIVIVANLIVDILYGVLDPRTRDARDVSGHPPRPTSGQEGLAVRARDRARVRAGPIRQSNLWKDAWRRYVPEQGRSRRRRRLHPGPPLLHLLADHLAVHRKRGELRGGETEPEPAASVRHRQVRPRPLHPHGRGRPGVDPDRLRRHLRHPRLRRHLRLDLRLHRRAARQRADALPRRALRPAVPALRDHHAPDIGHTDMWTMMIALSIASWFTTARIVRGQVITLKENDYVRAAKAVGARWYRVLTRHLLPNTLGILIIAIFLELPAVVLGEAFLSFIGLGISPPNASWGAMAQEGRTAYRVHPIEIVVPSLAIATLVICANFIADGLRDALDPRTKET